MSVETYPLSALQTGTNEIRVVGVNNLEPQRVDPNNNPAMVLFRVEITCAGVHDGTPPEITGPDDMTVETEGPEGTP